MVGTLYFNFIGHFLAMYASKQKKLFKLGQKTCLKNPNFDGLGPLPFLLLSWVGHGQWGTEHWACICVASLCVSVTFSTPDPS